MKFINITLFIIFVYSSLVLPVSSYMPKTSNPVQESWRWSEITELHNKQANIIDQNIDDKIWVSTKDNIMCSSNGIDWKIFNIENELSGSTVLDLSCSNDKVYVGTDLALNVYHNKRWRALFPENIKIPWMINRIHVLSDSTIWALSDFGLLHISGVKTVIYTSRDMADAVKCFAPNASVEIIPSDIFNKIEWEEGIGAYVINGFICAVLPNSPANKAGLKIGDRIISIDNTRKYPNRFVTGKIGQLLHLYVDRYNQNIQDTLDVKCEALQGQFLEFHFNQLIMDHANKLWLPDQVTQFITFDIQQKKWSRINPKLQVTPSVQKPRGLWYKMLSNGHIIGYHVWPEYGIYDFDGEKWIYIPLNALGGSNRNRAVCETRDGTLWVGGEGFLHALKDGSWNIYQAISLPMSVAAINYLFPSKDGSLWIITSYDQVFKVDLTSNQWLTYHRLNFQCETDDNTKWFLAQDNSVISHNNDDWKKYDTKDGLMEYPVALSVSKNGELWAAGSHHGIAATAVFRDGKWKNHIHSKFSWCIDYRSVYGASDGSMWFGSSRRSIAYLGFTGGVAQFKNNQWKYYAPPQVILQTYGIGEDSFNNIWIGGYYGLQRFDGEMWENISIPDKEINMNVDEVFTTQNRELWFSLRGTGLYHFKPNGIESDTIDGISDQWTLFDSQHGLPNNYVHGLLELDNGILYAGTDKGIYQFDGQTWGPTQFLMQNIRLLKDSGSLRRSNDGSIWLNITSKHWNYRAWPDAPTVFHDYEPFYTIKYSPDKNPPDTRITMSFEKISYPGNTSITWEGVDAWNNTTNQNIQYSWRLNDNEWSPFSFATEKIFPTLKNGKYTFQVRARDLDNNVDPVPAEIHFVVMPQVWKQPWFIILITLLLGVIIFQSIRVLLRDHRLQIANQNLTIKSNALEAFNRTLTIEKSIERIRTTIFSLRSSDSLNKVIKQIYKELNGLGVEFDILVCNIIDKTKNKIIQYGISKHSHKLRYHEKPLSAISDLLTLWSENQTLNVTSEDNLNKRLLKFYHDLYLCPSNIKMQRIIEVPHEYGSLSLCIKRVNENVDSQNILERITHVFWVGYSRLLDIQRIEEQQKELESVKLKNVQKKLKHELEMERLEKEKNLHIHKIKQEFFTNVSHELRTPLTLILAPMEALYKDHKFSGKVKEYLDLVFKNSQRLLKLVNQIMDMRKLEEGKLEIEKTKGDLVEFIQQVVNSYKPFSTQKSVDLSLKSNCQNLECRFDIDKLEKIIYNLLSNALKFTPRGGRVMVTVTSYNSLKQDGGKKLKIAVIKVRDTGVGISSEKLNKIFDRYYQAETDNYISGHGTGIGLSLTKELVELHGGKIFVQSIINKGTVFEIHLPVNGHVLSDKEFIMLPLMEEFKDADSPAKFPGLISDSSNGKIKGNKKPSLQVLVIEDNYDMQHFITSELESDYSITCAENGKEGYEIALETIPDLILCDVMMPVMNGVELCKAIKSDIRTDHIPVILLTARSAIDHQVEGIESGADDYITKPFNIKILKSKIKNTIQIRNQLHKKFSQEVELKPRDVNIPSYDEHFLESSMEIIEKYIDDPDFGVDEFAKEIGMSRTQLYRKVKALTNQTVHEFIRLMRLKRAAQLIKDSQLTITEIAYMVGFSDSSHFTRSFKKQFGKTPSQYLNCLHS